MLLGASSFKCTLFSSCISKIKGFSTHGESCSLGPEPTPTPAQWVQQTEGSWAAPCFACRMLLSADQGRGTLPFTTERAFKLTLKKHFTCSTDLEGRMPRAVSVLPSKTSLILLTTHLTLSPALQVAATLRKICFLNHMLLLSSSRNVSLPRSNQEDWSHLVQSLLPKEGKAQDGMTAQLRFCCSITQEHAKM